MWYIWISNYSGFILSFLTLFFFNINDYAYAQNDIEETKIRAAFPGRRIGGGTRGECSSRVLAHLVPATSTFSPGESGLLAFLKGPSEQPNPVNVYMRPYSEKNDNTDQKF